MASWSMVYQLHAYVSMLNFCDTCDIDQLGLTVRSRRIVFQGADLRRLIIKTLQGSMLCPPPKLKTIAGKSEIINFKG